MTPRDINDFGSLIKSLLDSIEAFSPQVPNEHILDTSESLTALALLCCDDNPDNRPSAAIVTEFLQDLLSRRDDPISDHFAEEDYSGASIREDRLEGAHCNAKSITPCVSTTKISQTGPCDDLSRCARRDALLADGIGSALAVQQDTSSESAVQKVISPDSFKALNISYENEADCVSAQSPPNYDSFGSPDSRVDTLGSSQDPARPPEKIIRLMQRLSKFQSLLDYSAM